MKLSDRAQRFDAHDRRKITLRWTGPYSDRNGLTIADMVILEVRHDAKKKAYYADISVVQTERCDGYSVQFWTPFTPSARVTMLPTGRYTGQGLAHFAASVIAMIDGDDAPENVRGFLNTAATLCDAAVSA